MEPKTVGKKKVVIIAAVAAAIVVIATVIIVAMNSGTYKVSRLLNDGNMYLAEHNYEKAIATFNDAIKIDPMNEEAYIGAADAYAGSGDYENAIEIIRKAQEILGEDFAKDKLISLKVEFQKIHIPHDFSEATCLTGEICKVCGAEGKAPLGHELTIATCTEPAKCSRCDYTEGEAGEHEWEEASFQHPKQCKLCGATEGEAVKGDLEAHGIVIETNLDEVFEGTFNARSDYMSYTGLHYKAWTSDYKVILSDANHPAKDGYVWQLITLNVVFGNNNDGKMFEYWDYSSARDDYYSTKLADDSLEQNNYKYVGAWKGDYYVTTWDWDVHFNIIYNGREVDAGFIVHEVGAEGEYFGMPDFNGYDCAPQVIKSEFSFCVPEGYDGNMATFYLNDDMVWNDGDYFYDVYRDDNHKENAIVYRLPAAILQ